MSEITIIVRIKANPGQAEAVELKLREGVRLTHAETGCIRFALLRSNTDEHVFLLVERWASQAALDEHLRQPHFLRRREELKALTEPSEASTYQLVNEGQPDKLL